MARLIRDCALKGGELYRLSDISMNDILNINLSNILQPIPEQREIEVLKISDLFIW